MELKVAYMCNVLCPPVTHSENAGAQLYPGHEIQAVNLALNLLPLSECYLCT